MNYTIQEYIMKRIVAALIIALALAGAAVQVNWSSSVRRPVAANWNTGEPTAVAVNWSK